MTRRILVAEDSLTQAAALTADLQEAGFETVHAVNGEAAVALLDQPFDLVISDIVMPGSIDGYQLCRKIKERTPLTPVVLLTGLSDPMDIIHGLDCGANNFITKPYEVRDLLDRIEILLRLRERRRQERFSMGVKILFMGREFEITAEREQILDMLVTTFEEAVKQNRELRSREEQLTAAKVALAKYAESLEARLERLADSVPEVLYSLELREGSAVYASKAAASVFGIEPEDFSLERWAEGLHAEDRERALEQVREAVVTARKRQLEYRYHVRAVDEVRWIEQTLIPVTDSDGAVARMDGIARDVTATRTSEERLRVQEERYRSLAFATAQIVWTTDPEGKVVEPLPSWQEFTGQPFDDVRGSGWLEAVHPDDRAAMEETRNQAVAERRHYDVSYRIRRHDGVYRWFIVRGVPVQNQDGSIREWVGTCADITEQREAQEQLRRSEERFHTIFDSSPLGVAIASTDGVIVDVNPAFTDMLGYTRDEVVGRTGASLRITDETSREAIYRRVDESWGEPIGWRVPARKKNGETIVVLGSSQGIMLEGQRSVITQFQDVTALTEAEEAVRRQSAYLSLLQSVTSTVAESTSLSDALAFASAAVCRETGWDAAHGFLVDDAEIIRHTGEWQWGPRGPLGPLRDATDDTAFESGKGMVGKVAASGRAEWVEDVEDASVFLRRNDTGLGVQTAVAVPITVAGRTEALLELFSVERRATDAQLLDVLQQIGTQLGRVAERERARREREAVEAQVRQAQKMDAIGRLAGGVAHDFNNLLTVILTEAQLLRQLRATPLDDDVAEALSEIVDAGQRAAALTSQLLTFSRRDIVEPKVLDPRDVVEGVRKMLGRLLGEQVRLHVVPTDVSGRVRADRGQLEQVIVNLAVNARDAMPDGGDMSIEVGDIDLDDDYAESHHGCTPGPYVAISVSDTGIGMSPEVQARVFEPFFTTKGIGRGTGLGLATSYGIVQECGGHIGVYSEVGKGTTMKVFLPRVDVKVPRDAVRKARPELPRGTETVLVVEDESQVRRTATRTLQALGYSVLSTSGGEEALEILASDTHLDLLFTDVVMPGMSGRALADRAKEIRPSLRVLFTTGYTDDIAFRSQLLENGVDVLTKPYNSGEFARKIRDVLDKSR